MHDIEKDCVFFMDEMEISQGFDHDRSLDCLFGGTTLPQSNVQVANHALVFMIVLEFDSDDDLKVANKLSDIHIGSGHFTKMKLLGPFRPSRHIAQHLCRLLRSETWRQIRLLKDCLLVACAQQAPPGRHLRRFSQEMRTVTQATEFFWKLTLATLPKKRKAESSEPCVKKIGDVNVPKFVEDVLGAGPKFSVAPRPDKTELLGMVRTVASKATQPEADRIVLESVEALPTKLSKIKKPAISDTVKVLQEKKLKLLQSDKEGGFVILTSSIYHDKATSAINENFVAARGFVPSKAKKKAVELCEQAGLSKLAASVKASKGMCLTAFFTVKTHMDSQPFRVIVTERDTWQRCLGSHLQRGLSLLKGDDPYLVKRPFDIKDLYYSLPHNALARVVQAGIVHFGPVQFQNTVGTSIESFNDLLFKYLESTPPPRTWGRASRFFRQAALDVSRLQVSRVNGGRVAYEAAFATTLQLLAVPFLSG
ncbi:hypothetical protein HPB52_005642 [Rhipicephalus sanguineus]|uniref:Transposable element P transposase-like RNase H domain-containing protein n=1 Tax=Rhipicephalus sanguineus TaxID=34632 RepID=A0A9D4PM47_RHISA|nr:hypothetical protein HPB52_005642 [Rhipicephalus sanguineus]